MSNDKDKLGPPAIDPLSNAAWSRIERGVFDRIDAGETVNAPPSAPSRLKWPWLVVPLVVAAAAAAAVLLVRTPTTPHDVVGTRVVQPTDEPSRVVAGDTSSSVSFGDAHLTLAPRAAIVMDHEGDAPSVMIDRGSTTFEVAPRNGRPAFIVRAADVVVRVVGTRFTVARSDERVDVSVDHGIVDVQYKAQVTRVTKGQHWSSDEPTKTAIVAPSEATLPVETKTPVEDTPADETPVEKTPPSEKPSAKPSASTITDRERFDQLSAMEATSPKVAIDGYLVLANSRSTWAPVALYAAGRLATDKNDSRAKSLLEQYLKRFPGGANAADARDLLDHLGASR
ncbi:MAG TPA: FecR domain-containing protein [Kofleriaceae bacterium]|jgi:hypothetical protein